MKTAEERMSRALVLCVVGLVACLVVAIFLVATVVKVWI